MKVLITVANIFFHNLYRISWFSWLSDYKQFKQLKAISDAMLDYPIVVSTWNCSSETVSAYFLLSKLHKPNNNWRDLFSVDVVFINCSKINNGFTAAIIEFGPKRCNISIGREFELLQLQCNNGMFVWIWFSKIIILSGILCSQVWI